MAAASVLIWCGVVGAWRSTTLVRAVDIISLLPLDTASATARVLPNDPQLAFVESLALTDITKVVFVAEPRGFGFPYPFVTVSQHDPSPLRSVLEASHNAEEAVFLLREQGFSHILVNWAELDRLRHNYPVTPWSDDVTRLRWSQLLQALGQPVLTSGGVQIFALSSR